MALGLVHVGDELCLVAELFECLHQFLGFSLVGVVLNVDLSALAVMLRSKFQNWWAFSLEIAIFAGLIRQIDEHGKKLQRQSLQWIREQILSPDFVASLATHDTDVEPHAIEL